MSFELDIQNGVDTFGEEAKYIGKSLSNLTNLKSLALNLSKKSISDEESKYIFDSLSKLKYLNNLELYLSSNGLSPESYKPLGISLESL